MAHKCMLAFLAVLSLQVVTEAALLKAEEYVNVIKFGISKNIAVKPDFCHGIDCPDFKVIKKTADYEERLYNATNWVRSNQTGMDLREATSVMYSRLFDYIQGANERKEKIAMTVPVMTGIFPGPGQTCENNFSMFFYMSPSVKDPPKPTGKNVYLESLSRGRVYVKSFGGFASKESWLKNAAELAAALQKDGEQFYNDTLFTGVYDNPHQIFNRHNEVIWVAA